LKTYSLKTLKHFDKQLSKLDKGTQRFLLAWMAKNLYNTDNPRRHGKGLTANRSGQWRYRVGNYRIIAQIRDAELIILALAVGHRRDIY
jgi:mRNA interferase RelE/StbE